MVELLAIVSCGLTAGCSTTTVVAPPAPGSSAAASWPGLAGGASESLRSSGSATAPSTVSGVTGEADQACPWIATNTAAALEGNLIGRVVTTRKNGLVVACTFHFDTNWGPDRVTLQITSTTYSDPETARNAMIRLGEAGDQPAGEPNLIPRVDGIRYQTAFYPPDGSRDWACSFAKDNAVVTVKTDQTNTSNDAYGIAKLVAGRI